MELRQLEYLVTIAEEGSFTRAAAKLHLSQPGVSAQIRQLEREFGEVLLDRAGRAVRLTEVGAAVLPFARAALDAVAGARLAVDELTGLIRGAVSVGSIPGCGGLDLPELLTGYHKQHPAIEINLVEANADQLIEALQQGRLEVAVIALAGAPPIGLATQLLIDEPIIAAVAHSDPLASCTTIPLSALRHRTLISMPRGSGLRTALDTACAVAGFEPRIGFEAGDPRMLVEFAARGLGVAILPQSGGETLHSLTVTGPAITGTVELAWRAAGPASPAARRFLTHARETLPDLRARSPEPGSR